MDSLEKKKHNRWGSEYCIIQKIYKTLIMGEVNQKHGEAKNTNKP
jgi:hypothetical protein